MEEKIFLFRDKYNIEDRDACKYLNYETPANHFHCEHYFGGVRLCGPNFWGGNFPPYDEVETFLTEEEYNKLISTDKELSELGYNIKKGDERYNKGIALCESLEPIFDKLRSEEAVAFKKEIMESEQEMMRDEYDLSFEDVETILDYRYDEYEDKGIVSCVYEDYEDLGMHYAEEVDSIPDHVQPYFDYERYGEDLAEEERFVELSDGRIVELSY